MSAEEEVINLGKLIGDKAVEAARQEAMQHLNNLLSVGGIHEGWGDCHRELRDAVNRRLASVNGIIRKRAVEKFLADHKAYGAQLALLTEAAEQETRNG